MKRRGLLAGVAGSGALAAGAWFAWRQEAGPDDG